MVGWLAVAKPHSWGMARWTAVGALPPLAAQAGRLPLLAAGDTGQLVGIDQVRAQPDGTAILSIVGQVPLGFTGVLKIDLDTGEAILEPHHFVDIAEVCEQLTG
jgi:hypothetical protein